MQEAILFLAQVTFAMTPLVLAAVGEVFTERAGIVNIGLEGIIMLGALVGAMAAEATLNPWVGLLAGAGVGALVGLVHGYISAYLKGDQVISGVGINTFAYGFVPYMIMTYWGVAGYHQVPEEARVPKLFGLVSPVFVLAVVAAVATHIILFRTSFGLKIRALGEEPEAADVLGVHVERLQLLATVYGGALTGLAGAFMSIDWLSTVTKEIAAGRGFIALALVVFSNWKPLMALAGGALFGSFWTLAEWLKVNPSLKAVIPITLLNTIPYIATLVVVAGVVGKVRPPRKVGVPYRRE